eukprot:TRINITY_DN26388_c1_g1_i1.p1 TRINITY_DN26388_c1_g1~~TRINITY_DN26388_c1_g1_i1.p1  ORF type:complete len:197 (+),score=31.11 TRINITY_DN26388_c1_g1_i1:136-726(+)
MDFCGIVPQVRPSNESSLHENVGILHRDQGEFEFLPDTMSDIAGLVFSENEEEDSEVHGEKEGRAEDGDDEFSANCIPGFVSFSSVSGIDVSHTIVDLQCPPRHQTTKDSEVHVEKKGTANDVDDEFSAQWTQEFVPFRRRFSEESDADTSRTAVDLQCFSTKRSAVRRAWVVVEDMVRTTISRASSRVSSRKKRG